MQFSNTLAVGLLIGNTPTETTEAPGGNMRSTSIVGCTDDKKNKERNAAKSKGEEIQKETLRYKEISSFKCLYDMARSSACSCVYAANMIC